MHNDHTRSINKSTQMYPNRKNVHVLFYEQALCEKGKKMAKVLLYVISQYNLLLKAMLAQG